MPGGKLGAIAGAGVWTRRLDGDVVMRSSLSYGISVRSLKRYRSARKAKKQPKAATIKEWRQRLREAFKRYRVDCGRHHPTATELRESLQRIRTAARRYASEGDLHRADKLLERLEADKNVEKIIRQSLWTADLNWPGFKRELRDVYAVRATPTGSVDVAKRIAEIDIEELVPEPGPWRDPALFKLVSVVAPIWEEVTDRTAALVSPDNDDRKRCPFAEWLGSMLELIGQPRPSVGSVVDIVRAQKSENPAPVKAEKY